MPLQIRRGTEAERLTMTVPLAPGEPLYTTDQGFLYIGNGTTLGGVQVTGYQDENAVDAVGNALTNGTHQNIVFIYDEFPQDVSNRIDSYIDLSYYDGEISAPAFRGSVLDDGSLTLVNATNGSINLDGTVKGDIVPDANETYDIGSSSYRFRDLYLSGSSLYLGTAQITATGSIVDLPVGSTVGGLPISALEGIVPGSNYNANIIADDSSVMVNTSTQEIFATNGFFGNLTGNVVGDVIGNTTGLHVGEVRGSVFADDSSLLVNGIDRIFNGTLDTGTSTFSSTGITSPGIPFLIGNPDSSIDVQFYLGDNLQIRSVDPNGRGYITSTMSRGTLASPAAIQAGDEIGGILFRAYTDSSTVALSGIINFTVDPTAVIAGGNFVKSQIVMGTATDSTLDPNSVFTLDSAGVATTNAFSANQFFQLPVFADDAARLAAIPTPAAGMMIFMTSGTTPAAANKMQLFDGSNWVNLN